MYSSALTAACLFGPLIGRGLDRWPPRVLLGASCLARCALLLALSFADPQTAIRYAAVAAFLTTILSLAYGPAVAKALPCSPPSSCTRRTP